ncbi:LysR family transcriptional regulator [Hephaestia mangrovi]|uniref:LysR family transcriptional regulator n=1 Tax=Hephaestia mangrovi TaxID=2873268 RepID=UPI001CA704FC|nr:LysR family transcriptional regulator [Hephaestia mangrovi]MBY8826869.1 LysR family transcriptional regulator [Hephaestia mangrovi]
MTLEQLRIFVAVAERQHMTRAATALNLTQSAVSAAVAALETRHDVRLFHRVGRRIELTEAGEALLDDARALLSSAAAAEQALADRGRLLRGRLALAASQTIAGYWLPRFLARFSAAHPGVAIDLAIGNSAQAAAQVLTGTAELGFVEGRIDDPALARWQIGEDRLQLVRAEPAGAVDAGWLAGARWVMREPGSGTRTSLEAALGELGVATGDLDVAMTLPSNEAVRTAVAAGQGIAGLSSLVVEPLVALGRLHPIDVKLAPRPFYALRHKERYRSRAADVLIEMIAAC